MTKKDFSLNEDRMVYFAPVCEQSDIKNDAICVDSVGVGTEDFEKGDDYVW